ncbi:MAG: NAD(P)H-dependent amine dehydrogenase family protein [Limisphaerales bacterium]
MRTKIKIAQFGLGPIGVETLRLAATKPWIEIVGGVDIDPVKAGKNLATLTGIRATRNRKVHGSLDELLRRARPDVILHTAVSRLRAAFEQIKPMVQQGISVVSSCEELVFPQLREPRLAKQLDALCRRTGARVVGAGVNPGFAMDVLPLCLSGVSCAVKSISIERVVNASTRREPLQRKIGSGRPPGEFRLELKAGKAGHAGLRDSLALLAHALGWELGKLKESADVVIAAKDIRTRYLRVRKGQACGIHQRAEARFDWNRRLTLDLKMYLDAPEPHDRVRIEGEPPLDLLVAGGIAGDPATAAALVNTVPRLLSARAGLVLLTDLPVPRFC